MKTHAAKIITVANQKGGTGKTVTVITLGHGLARRGYRVLLIDFDQQGTVAYYLGLEKGNEVFGLLCQRPNAAAGVMETQRENLLLLRGWKQTAADEISRRLFHSGMDFIEKILAPFRSQYDYILCDTSPAIGGLQEKSIWAADLLLVPVETEAGAVQAVAELFADLQPIMQSDNPAIRWKGALLGILPTKHNPNYAAHRYCLNELKTHYGEAAVCAPIRLYAELYNQVLRGQTIYEVNPDSRTCQDYEQLVDRVLRVR